MAILLKQSTITKILVYPDAVESGKSLTKSMVTPSQRQEGGDSGMLHP